MKEKNLLIPNQSFLRVDLSPIPDLSYFVNSDFLLESNGQGHMNMSCIGAQEGVYKPEEALGENCWSVIGINIYSPWE